ncbi:MAG: AAC(3) family N-acetyltransferase [Planctomycetota bacterium]|nr:MAG: AAC(3) family N-acetyltransferase [Planctomycetota bacterium]
MRRFLFENTRCSSVRRRVLDTEAGGARAEGSTELDREAWLRLQLGGEAASIVPEAAPVTKAQITAKLQELGVEEGGLLLLHASLSALGWVCGGEYALLQGVLEALGPEGTVIVATQSSYNSDPSQWQAPAVPKTWWPVIRAEMPAFDPARSPSRGMGRVAELLRSWPGAFRSSHPAVSFAGLGPMAEELLSEHPLDHPLGEDSPLARLYQEDADLLLLGCGYESCTAFHLAEHRAGIREIERAQAAVLIDGQRRWVAYEQIDYDSSIFPELGAAFESASALAQGQLGQAELKLFAMRAAVDFASDHFRQRC